MVRIDLPEENSFVRFHHGQYLFFMTQLFIRNMQFSTSTFGLLQCHDIYAAIEIDLDRRSLDEAILSKSQ